MASGRRSPRSVLRARARTPRHCALIVLGQVPHAVVEARQRDPCRPRVVHARRGSARARGADSDRGAADTGRNAGRGSAACDRRAPRRRGRAAIVVIAGVLPGPACRCRRPARSRCLQLGRVLPSGTATSDGRSRSPPSPSSSTVRRSPPAGLPETSFQARSASRNIMTWPLSSTVPWATSAGRRLRCRAPRE